MPIFLAALFGALMTVLGSIVGRVLVALGMGYVTFTGVSFALNTIKVMFFSSLLAAHPLMLGYAATLKLDISFQVILAAVTMKWVLNSGAAAITGNVKKLVIK